MTEKQIIIGQALLSALAKVSPDTTALRAEQIRLNENGFTDQLDTRTVRFLEHLGLIEVMVPVGDTPMLLRLTYEGFLAEEQGLGDYLVNREEKIEAKHKANLAVIKGQSMNVAWFVANAIFAIVNIIYRSWPS